MERFRITTLPHALYSMTTECGIRLFSMATYQSGDHAAVSSNNSLRCFCADSTSCKPFFYKPSTTSSISVLYCVDDYYKIPSGSISITSALYQDVEHYIISQHTIVYRPVARYIVMLRTLSRCCAVHHVSEHYMVASHTKFRCLYSALPYLFALSTEVVAHSSVELKLTFFILLSPITLWHPMLLIALSHITFSCNVGLYHATKN